MLDSPNVSVVIPCYNAEGWVGRAIESVLGQEGVLVEVIVVDDGSTDGSLDVIRGYDDIVQWHSVPNRGACAARNFGLEIVGTRYVMFLDADDYIEGPFLKSALDALLRHKGDVAFGRISTETSEGRTPFHPEVTKSSADAMMAFLEKGFIPPCGTVWSSDFVRQIGGWKEGLRRYQDYELTFRALSVDPRVVYFAGGYGVYFQHATPDRISSKFDLATVNDQASTIRFVGQCVSRAGIPKNERSRLMQNRAYRLWRQACRHGDQAAITVARSLYAEFGGTGHVGSFAHRTIASALGLRRKEWLALCFAKTFQNLIRKPMRMRK